MADPIPAPKLTRLNLSRALEEAMSDEVYKTAEECEDIWAGPLPIEKKNELIRVLNDSKNLKERMLAARQFVVKENAP